VLLILQGQFLHELLPPQEVEIQLAEIMATKCRSAVTRCT
jgi:hypothetical protein